MKQAVGEVRVVVARLVRVVVAGLVRAVIGLVSHAAAWLLLVGQKEAPHVVFSKSFHSPSLFLLLLDVFFLLILVMLSEARKQC